MSGCTNYFVQLDAAGDLGDRMVLIEEDNATEVLAEVMKTPPGSEPVPFTSETAPVLDWRKA